MHVIAKPAALIGRILLAAIFILAGANKLGDISGTEAYIQSVGLPAGLAIPAALFELIGGICIAIGFLVRPLAILFAGFCIVTAVMFHNSFAEQVQVTMFLKNLSIAGGFLLLFAYGNVAYSLDSLRSRRKHDRELSDAELRAAKAEARADATEATH